MSEQLVARSGTANRQLTYLFLCNLVILLVGMGLFPVLPLYAAQFGATPSTIGIYLAVTYLSIALGAMLTSKLAEIVPWKALFAAAGILGMSALVLLGKATAMWQVVVLTSMVWFSGGIGLTLVSVLTGLVAERQSRGKSFSLVSLAQPAGAVLGGAFVGQLVAWQGYPLMFSALGVTWIALPVISIFGLENMPIPHATRAASGLREAMPRLGRTFYLLLLITLIATMVVNGSRLGVSLSMQVLDFSPNAVASTSIVSGLVTIPVTFLVGTLSDSLGRKHFLALSYLLAGVGALTLITASQLWHFWVAASLILVARTVSTAVSSAFATDLLLPVTLNLGLPWLNTITWLAGVISFASIGYVVDGFGTTTLYLSMAALAVIAGVQLSRLQQDQTPGVPTISPARESREMTFSVLASAGQLEGCVREMS